MKNREEKEMEDISNEINKLIVKREIEKALNKSSELILKAKNYKSDIYTAKSNAIKGFIYYSSNETNKAISHFEIALKIYLECERKYFNEIKEICNSLGVLYKNLGELKKSIEILKKSIEISEKYLIQNSISYNNIGLVYYAQEEYKKSINYFKKAIEIEKKNDKINRISTLKYHINVANAYCNINDFENAKKIYTKTFKFCKKEEEYELIIVNLKGIANLMISNNDFESAESYLKKAIYLSEKNDFKVYLLDILLYLSSVYNKTKRDELQIQSLKHALNIAKDSYPARMLEVLLKIYKYYLKNQNFKDAHETLARIHLLHKENAQKEKDEKLLEFQEQFEAQQKDKLIIQEQKFNKSLQESNQKLRQALADQQALELHIKSLQLQLSPHFIFNTLQSIQGYIFNKSPFETSDYLADFAKLMRNVLKASRELAIPLHLELSLLQNYVSLEQKRFKNSFDYQEQVDEDINKENTLIPSFLIQPFIENAILHGVNTQKNGVIYLVIRKKKKGYYIHIIDNGRGRDAAALLEKKTHQGKSMALDILTERCSLSKDSPNFSYNYKIFNRFSKSNNTGTHVVLSVENKKMKS